ncbi:MAG: hypothetical protein H6627_09325 [Calditrichae bacterium]|nr:hypothetical protein [Calditrichota bacterium]MCB9058756.1 hypothetical protein [Calditrichia bacterium]
MKVKLLATIIFLLFLVIHSNAQIAVIANKSVPVDTISKVELLDFYIGDIKEWNDNRPVVLVDFSTATDTKSNFYKFIGRRSSRIKSIWIKKMLSGEGDPPIFLENTDEMIRKIAKTPGAIGYADLKEINKTVKVLLVIK